ncbi:MAG: PAS domain-containing protein [Methanospirillum sp.]
MTPASAPGAGPSDPLAATLPLLRVIPAPAILYRPDGTIAGSSAAFEELLGRPVEGLTNADLADLFDIRFPTGKALYFGDLCRELRVQRNPQMAIDLRDGSGRFRAMIASGAAVRSGDRTVGAIVLFTEVTGLIQANGTARS